MVHHLPLTNVLCKYLHNLKPLCLLNVCVAQDVVGRFNERMVLSLASCGHCLLLDDELNVLPTSSLIRWGVCVKDGCAGVLLTHMLRGRDCCWTTSSTRCPPTASLGWVCAKGGGASVLLIHTLHGRDCCSTVSSTSHTSLRL